VTKRKRTPSLREAGRKGGKANTPAQQLARLRNISRAHVLRAEKRQMRLDLNS